MSIDIRSRMVLCGKPRMSILSCEEESTRPIPHCFLGTKKDPINIESGGKDGGEDRREHTSYLSRKPREFLCKFFLAGVNFYRLNAKNWHFRQILCEKVAFFLQI